MKKIGYAALLVFMLLFVILSASQAQTPQHTLNQYIADLQKNPGDYALREKIIRHVQTMKPAPAIREEARRQYVMGKTLFEDARNVQEFKDAIGKFRQALLMAPWWPEANRDLGMALQAALEYDEAIRALKLYIATNPGEELSRRAQNEIYKVEAKQEKTAKEKTAATAHARVEEKKQGLRDLSGNWYRKEPYDHRLFPYDSHYHYRAEMRGETLVFIEVIDIPFFGFRRGQERDFFIVNSLGGNKLIGRLHHYEGVLEMIISRDFNDLEFLFNGTDRKTYTRR